MTSLFIDEKDSSSKLILSHIYLLVGLSLPLWISDINTFNLCQLSGLITVGIGDSFASLIGSRFGKHKLPGSCHITNSKEINSHFKQFLKKVVKKSQSRVQSA